MENREDFVVFDSVQAEDNFLQGKTSTPTASSRRLSAAGKAALLKSKILIAHLHSPSDRRISLPRASKASKATSKSLEQPAAAGTPGPTPTDKFIREQLAALTAMISSVKTDIDKAETRTVEKIDSKVDDLAGKMETRVARAETELTTLGADMASTRQQLESIRLAAAESAKAIPGIVNDAITARLASKQDDRPPTGGDRPGGERPGRRPRPLPPDFTA